MVLAKFLRTDYSKSNNACIINDVSDWRRVRMSEGFMRGGTMVPVKKYFCFIVACFFLSGSLSLQCALAEGGAAATRAGMPKGSDAKGSVSEQQAPHISFAAAEYDVGEVFEGAIISHDFIVKNTGTALLEISDVKPG